MFYRKVKTSFPRVLGTLLALTVVLCGCGKGKESAGKKISGLGDLNRPDCVIACESEIFATRAARERFPQAKFMEFSNCSDCVLALESGKVAAVVYDRARLDHVVTEHPNLTVLPEDVATEHIAVAARRDFGDVMGKINEFIRMYMADGTYDQMYRRWISTPSPVMPDISAPAHPVGKLVVGVTGDNFPMSGVSYGKYVGFDIEFARRLALFLNMDFELHVYEYNGLLAALEGKKIDIAIAQMDATPERSESVLFSDSYINSAVAMLVRAEDSPSSEIRSFDDLAGKKVGVLTGSIFDALAEQYLPKSEVMSFSQVNQEIIALRNGKISAFLCDGPQAGMLFHECPDLAGLPREIPCGDYAFAFPKQGDGLCRQFAKEIRKMKQDGTIDSLQEKWFSNDERLYTMSKADGTGRALRFATVPELPPFSFMKDGAVVGYDVEIASLAAAKLGFTLVPVPIDAASFIENIVSGKCDFGGGCVIVTRERMERVLFCEPTYKGKVIVVVRNDSGEKPEISLGRKIADAGKSLMASWNRTFVRESRWRLILRGLEVTLCITVFSVVLGTLLAFPVCMMCRSKNRTVSRIGNSYVSLIMGTPILVTLMILYYVVFRKVDIRGEVVAIIAFAMDFAAYTSVTLRSGIDGVPRGQTEAALALGFPPRSAFLRFVLPQAVRATIGVYTGEVISTLKTTSIVGYIAIMDLTKMGDIIRSRTYEAFFPLIAIAAIYFASAKLLAWLLGFVEKGVDPLRRRDVLRKRGVK
ncbi:MAG: ABC transporter permease subunit [Victivallaceae bacterium]|nr:ABC transporter permease subunit [Victivallaceae bacterium]